MSDFQDAFDQGAKQRPIASIDPAIGVVAVAEGFTLTDVSKWLEAPMDKRGTVSLFTAQSFIDYVQAYRDADTLVACDLNTRTVTASLDYHRTGDGDPRHGLHRAVYGCRLTKEWEAWTRASGKRMTQMEFAEFLEDNLPDIASPAGALVLQMASDLSVKKDVAFASSSRLRDGQQQVNYSETISDGSTSRGDLKLAETIVLGIAPFEGGDKYQIDARLRFRITDGKLALWVDLLRPHKVIEDAFNREVATITAALAPTRVVHGKI